jgi:succinate-acetate transporter protein
MGIHCERFIEAALVSFGWFWWTENLVRVFFTQGFKANPGLELANAFSVLAFLLLSQLFKE